MRVLVTGGAGFVGSHLVPMLVERGDSVLVLDDLSIGGAVPDERTAETFVAPLGDPGATRRIVEFGPELVIHLAARHVIPWCERNPRRAEEVNVDGTRWLLEVLGKTRPERIVFASSIGVYGFHDEPATEDMERAPQSVYARTKVSGEDLVRDYAALHEEATVAMVRLANVFGRGDLNAHLIPQLAAELGGEIRVGNLWPERDYVHVSDVARAILAVADLGPGLHTYNVGTGAGTTVSTIVETLAELTGVAMTAVPEPSRERADDGHLLADPSALRAATGWRARVGLQEGLVDVLESANGSEQGEGAPRSGEDGGDAGVAGSAEDVGARAGLRRDQVEVLGVRISAIRLPDLMADLRCALRARTRLTLTFANPNYLVRAKKDPALRAQVNSFDHILTDGWGVMLAARMLGKKIPERLANDDLVRPLFGALAEHRSRVFLLGSAPGVADAAAVRLSSGFPGLNMVGTMHGYLDVEEGLQGWYSQAAVDRMVDAVNQADPDFLVVGLPTPKQQRFVTENLSRLTVPVIMTGGAWIDHLAERVDFYPRWVNRSRLCWAYRWAHEPRRLTHRYTVELADFGRRVLWQRLSSG